jgi:hypothetical protein
MTIDDVSFGDMVVAVLFWVIGSGFSVFPPGTYA